MSSLNHNQGKPKWSLLLTDFADELREVLRVREVIEASGKYDRMNFAQSQGKPEAKVFLEDNLDSMERHIFDRRKNKHIDHETKCYHMAHICVRALIDLSYALHDKQALSKEEREDIIQEDARALDYALARQELSTQECEDILQDDVSLQCIESRYPWNEAPGWANYAAIDSNSIGIWYAERPEPNDLQWISNYKLARIGSKMLSDGENWKTTLEERPKC